MRHALGETQWRAAQPVEQLREELREELQEEVRGKGEIESSIEPAKSRQARRSAPGEMTTPVCFPSMLAR